MRIFPLFSLIVLCCTLGCGGDAAKSHNDNLPPVDSNAPRISPAGTEKGGNSPKEAAPKVIQ